MTAIECPALDGREALGFLAAVGCLRLLADHGDPDATLAWSPATATAVVDTAVADDTAGLAGWLIGLIDGLAPGQVIPGAPADLPPPGGTKDRLRVGPEHLRAYTAGLPNGTDLRWITSLVTDLVLDKNGRSQISLFTAPSGQQKMRTMLEQPLERLRRAPVFLTEALDGWSRVSGYTGEYLDHRAQFDAADAPDGKSAYRGVPGATWLALMAYPLLRTTSSMRGRLTSGWHHVGGRPVFRWPLWRYALDVDAVQVLLEHPLLDERGAMQRPEAADVRRGLDSLGVFGLHEAARRGGDKSAGVLAPLRTTG